MTLAEAQREALQILSTYSIDGVVNADTYNNQADTKIRLIAFANAAQMEIARTNGRIMREFNYVTFENDMIYSTALEEVEVKHGETTTFTGDAAHSYSINICGDCEINISVGGVVVDTVTVYPTSGQFVCYKGVIDNDDDDEVEIEITSDYDYIYKNVALYKNKYPDDDSVREYSTNYKVEVPDDLIEPIQGQVYFNNRRSNEYRSVGRDIYIENDSSGMWTFGYYALPQEITSDTPLTYEFEVPAQIQDAIPFKMAYLTALDAQGVSSSVLTAIKNEYSQLLSSAIEEPRVRKVSINNAYGV